MTDPDDLHVRDVGQDVRELGALLGEVLSTQASREALETVEGIRQAAIDARDGDDEAARRLEEYLAGLDAAETEIVARAFTTYFELINLAEERARVRTIRERGGAAGESIAAAVEHLADRGAAAETVQRILDDVLIQPTFTAHPTEARRKTVKAKLQTVASVLRELDERRLTDAERFAVERDLEAEITSLWQTPQVRDRPPEVADEALNVQWYLENVLFEVVGDVYDRLERTLEAEYPDVEVPKLFEFRSWAGSDRDGNPHVTPDVTAATLARQREVVVSRYVDALDRLMGVLSQDADRVSVGDAVQERLAAYQDRLPGVAEAAAERNPTEPYRRLLRLMTERLERIDDLRPGGYEDPAELLRDLRSLATDLRRNDAEAIAEAHLDPLRRQVETFGFALAALDVRDHREQHTTAVGEALARADVPYRDLAEGERVTVLTDAIVQEDPVVDLSDTGGLGETASRVCRRFDALADWQETYGVDAVDTYCISMCEAPSHVLEVLFLADQAGVVDLPGYAGLDVVPLLETESALSGAREIMGTLFENEAYAAALEARNGVQEVMLGYSDSCKENGYLAAQWSLHRNQKRLAAITDEFDVELRLFHGRGGSISRGGGPMNEALLALPPETVTGEVTFTEQGEAISEKYANPAIARRELAQMLDAQVRARHQALSEPVEDVPDEWRGAMATASEAAREAYLDLLDTPAFLDFFGQATPIRVIEDLNLGSRPASRSGERTVEDLRAIPWVFAWTQARCIVPGWYSLGAGLDAYLESGDLATLEGMYREWPFFRTMIDNASMALARTDLDVAEEYASLADADVRERIFPIITAEYERSRELVLEITGRDELIEREWLAESLRRRNPYVDPLNRIQVGLLEGEVDERASRTLRLTVKGVAAGMKNTG
ncbi:MAG: phosphoenolpyruvate carboxylase [Haloarculaceae archaeon]